MELITTLALLAVVSACTYIYIRHSFTYWQRKGFPFVPPKLPYGNLINGLGHEQLALLLDRLYQPLKGQGPVGGMYFLHRPFALALDINFVKQMLIKDFHHFEDRGIYYNEKDDPISAHLFAVDAEQWRRLRHKLSPTFTSGKMKFMFPTVINVAQEFEKTLTTLVPAGDTGTDLEIRDILARFTLDVIGTCAFGIECNSLKNPDTEFKSMGLKTLEERPLPITLGLVLASYANLSRRLGRKNFADQVSEFFTNIVTETIAYRLANGVSRNDFLDLLMKLKSDTGSADTLTMNEIVAQSFVFFIAGFETSSTTMTYALYELAKHPHMQQRLRDEFEAVLEKHDGRFTYEAMGDMQYLEQVINETLRKHPPVGQIRRRVTKEYRISGTTITLPVGMTIFVPVYSMHRDPELFPNPDEFIPERFADNVEQSTKNYMSFLAFGHGPRNCIGLRFGMMQTRLGLITLLMNFEVSVCGKTMDRMEYSEKNVIMVPKGGMWLNLKRLT